MLVITTLVVIAAATLPFWVHYLGYVVFFAEIAKKMLEEATAKGKLMALLALSIPATVGGVLILAIVLALREKLR